MCSTCNVIASYVQRSWALYGGCRSVEARLKGELSLTPSRSPEKTPTSLRLMKTTALMSASRAGGPAHNTRRREVLILFIWIWWWGNWVQFSERGVMAGRGAYRRVPELLLRVMGTVEPVRSFSLGFLTDGKGPGARRQAWAAVKTAPAWVLYYAKVPLATTCIHHRFRVIFHRVHAFISIGPHCYLPGRSSRSRPRHQFNP